MENNFEFNYKRADDFTEPKEPPLIRIFESYNQLQDISQDESWKKHRLYKLYDRAQPLLSALLVKAKTVKSLELNDFTPEAKETRRKDHLRPAYESLLNIISEERRTVQQNVKNMELRILNVSNPAKPREITDRLDFNDRMKEIRQIIRAKENMQDRIKLVQKHLDAGDPSFLHALVLSPDEIIPTNRLNEIRRQYAFRVSPTMQNAENDAIALAEAVTERTSQLAGTAVEILREKGLDIPISRETFFTYFPTDDEFEQARQERLINMENDVLKRQRQREEFDEQHSGINMN